MKNKKENKKMKRVGFGILIVCALVIGTVFSYVAVYNLGQNNVNFIGDIIDEIIQPEVEVDIAWQVIEIVPAVGENDPGDAGGFMSIFWLDYGATPAVDLQDNSSDWATNATVHAYEDTDATTTDTVSEDPSYIVVRAKFNVTHAKDGADWNGSRCRCTLTASGDETISQTVVGNDTAETYGGGIESDNNSAYSHIYINFYFDDNSDGYRITDDGTVTWSVKIEAKW